MGPFSRASKLTLRDGPLMLTTGAATAIALITVTASGLTGALVGLAMCPMLRLSWSLKIAIVDAVVAGISSIALACVLAAIAMNGGRFHAGVGGILLAAVTSVVVRHLVRRKVGRQGPRKRSSDDA
jgi:hypothetical protein